MGYHHLALAAKDMKAIHHFYETVMGFTGEGRSWAVSPGRLGKALLLPHGRRFKIHRFLGDARHARGR